jgi:methionyl-tRNA formyltransferase
MKIEFLTQDDPLYILPFFEEFFRHHSSEFEIAQVSICRVMGKRSRTQLLKELAHLYGPLGFVRVLSRAASARALGALPLGRDAKRFRTLAQLCRAYGVPYKQIASPNAAEFIAEVRQRGSDLMVSVACPYILKDTLLNVPPLGCVNIHHAPLPRYKGMMPTFWQMYHGEKKVGVTIHYMAAKVDEGAALLQEELEIQPGESLDQLIQRSKRHGAHCMARVLHEISAGTQQALTLKQEEGSYFTFPTIEQIREFHRRGFRAI